MGNPFFISDVFCTEKFSGNQLATVLVKSPLSDDEMQKIAMEFNFPETTFILNPEEKKPAFDVRIFTPDREVPFAGHPTLGTSFIIWDRLLKRATDKIILNLKVGEIPVTVEEGGKILWMKQRDGIFGEIHDREETAKVLSLPVNAIGEKFPVQEVSTGLPFIMVPLTSLEFMKQARVDMGMYEDYFSRREENPFFLFCDETYDKKNQINARMFAHIFGIAEDPATGSASGCLGEYMQRYKFLGNDPIDISLEQGFEIGRNAIINVKVEDSALPYNRIAVGGRVIVVAEGMLC